MYYELVLIGLVVGVLVGLTGVGGGSILTPLLIGLHFDPLVAVGTDLLYNVPSKVFGAFLHMRQKTVDWSIVGWLCAGGIPASLLGSCALIWLRAHVRLSLLQTLTQHAVGCALLLAATAILLSPWLLRSRRNHPPALTRSNARIVAIGAIVGVVVTVTSIGSGALTLPLLALALPAFGLGKLVGSDIAFSACLVPLALIARMNTNDINVPVSLTLLVGSLPGIYIGSRLCAVLQQRYLRPAVALTLVAVGAHLAL